MTIKRTIGIVLLAIIGIGSSVMMITDVGFIGFILAVGAATIIALFLKLILWLID